VHAAAATNDVRGDYRQRVVLSMRVGWQRRAGEPKRDLRRRLLEWK
jgi:hypothetical protein